MVDFGSPPSAAVYLGPVETHPEYNEKSTEVAGALVETRVTEGTWSSADLPAGSFWIWVSRGSQVTVRGCAPGAVSDPTPAP